MLRFTTNLKQRITSVYKPGNRSSKVSPRLHRRSRKLRVLQSQFHDALSDSGSEGGHTAGAAAANNSQAQDDDEVSKHPAGTVSPSHDIAQANPDVHEEDSPGANAPANGSQTRPEDSAGPTDEQQLAQPEDEALEDETEDPEMARWNKYITFNGEDETDYTEGPARMILTSDGVKTCAALLMTLPLSTAIQEAIAAQNSYAKVRRAAAEKSRANATFSDELEDAFNNQNLLILKEEGGDEDRLQQLRDELHVLELMRESHRVRQIHLENEQNDAERHFREAHETANSLLQDAFTFAQLIQPEDGTPNSPTEPLDLQKEYEETVRQLQEMTGEYTAAAPVLDTSEDHLVVQQEPLTAEQQQEQNVIHGLWAAQQRYETANASFDRRADDRNDEWMASLEAATRGEAPADASPEDFDLRWVQRIQELTRELIEAECALSVAKAAAAEQGVDIPMNDHTSGFADDVVDGYRMSMEQGMIDSVPAPGISDWMSGIPEVASPSFNEQAEDADDWDADEVGVSDSISMVATDAGERKKIDKWRRVCGLE